MSDPHGAIDLIGAMAIVRGSLGVLAATAATALVAACSSSGHPGHAPASAPGSGSSPAASPSVSASASPSVLPPLLPADTQTPAVWSKAYAATQFQELLGAFNSQSGGASITSSSTFAEYVQYSQRIADACDPFLNGLRSGNWPVDAQATIVAYTRLQQVVCDVELARGQAGTVQQYEGVLPAPTGTSAQLLQLRLKVYSELGI